MEEIIVTETDNGFEIHLPQELAKKGDKLRTTDLETIVKEYLTNHPID